MTDYKVRRFQSSEREYEALAALLHAASPEGRFESGEELEREDREWPKASLFVRVAAYSAGEEMAAVGTCYEAYWQESPFTAHARFDTHPDHPQVQLLPVLFEGVLGVLAGHKCRFRSLVCRAKEDDGERVGFLLRNGFREAMRFPSSTLRVEAFDASVWAETYDRLALEKIRLVTLSQFRVEEPDWKRELCSLRWKIVQDVPSTEPLAKPTIAEFEEMVLGDPALVEEAFFIALGDDGALVGMSNLWRNDPEGRRLDAGLTGVIRSHRRRGIATALKLRTIEFAQANGAETIETSNEEDSPMLALNFKLGFESNPAWVDFVRELQA
ncbi:MAG: GNAT family N-acetyltransferase [Caldilineaceae bacterium]|nr:GNAT family N-acetyltransferase [Caldilineaceae bacterium]